MSDRIVTAPISKIVEAIFNKIPMGSMPIGTDELAQAITEALQSLPTQDEREVLKAEDYIKSQAHFCKWIDELTANEYSHLKDMLNEFYEINKQPTTT